MREPPLAGRVGLFDPPGGGRGPFRARVSAPGPSRERGRIAPRRHPLVRSSQGPRDDRSRFTGRRATRDGGGARPSRPVPVVQPVPGVLPPGDGTMRRGGPDGPRERDARGTRDIGPGRAGRFGLHTVAFGRRDRGPEPRSIRDVLRLPLRPVLRTVRHPRDLVVRRRPLPRIPPSDPTVLESGPAGGSRPDSRSLRPGERPLVRRAPEPLGDRIRRRGGRSGGGGRVDLDGGHLRPAPLPHRAGALSTHGARDRPALRPLALGPEGRSGGSALRDLGAQRSVPSGRGPGRDATGRPDLLPPAALTPGPDGATIGSPRRTGTSRPWYR